MIQSAGRSRLLELRRDRATARDGRALLDRKREAILRAISERLPKRDARRALVASALRRARAHLAEAQLQSGRTAVDAAALAQPRMGELDVSETRLVGVALPEVGTVPGRFVPRYGPAGVAPALDRAGADFTALIPDILLLATQEAALRRLRRALARTVRRLNALDLIVLPELSREIHNVSTALEEEERDEAVRRKRWQTARSVVRLTIVTIALACAAVTGAAPFPDDVATAIQRVIDSGDPVLGSLEHSEKADVNALYRDRGYSPLWLDAAGSPTRDARDAMELMAGAADDGLDPDDYGYGRIMRLTPLLAHQTTTTDLARFDVAVSAGTLCFLRHLHSGRVDPRALGFRLNMPADRHDFAAELATAVSDHRFAAAADDLRPPLAQYGLLRTALKRYRALAAHASTDVIPSTKTVHPGESYQGAAILHRQLVALGDLAPDTEPPTTDPRYNGALVDGVKHFQMRHGLAADGVIGKGTQAALQVPLAWRVRQIELSLERLRWLPHVAPARVVSINIPMFQLWAWDAVPARGAASLTMEVIVGRAISTQTPVFIENMEEVIFRPYWNVPSSILRQEILPALARDPRYLQRQNMEIVRGPGDDARVVEMTAENLAELRTGVLRLRQRPGPRNSLGLIKFVLPNEENVYMHGTPAQELFSRSRRDFSHGCVRVRDPVALAEWVLSDLPDWSRERILESMNASESLHVRLDRPIQVFLFYTTAAVMPDDGAVRFAEDLYRHDARLDRALAKN
jgi:L,D-transpeptidase YcbB